MLLLGIGAEEMQSLCEILINPLLCTYPSQMNDEINRKPLERLTDKSRNVL